MAMVDAREGIRAKSPKAIARPSQKEFIQVGKLVGTPGHIKILLDGGPLVVANAWVHETRESREDLFRIYHKALGFTMGPYYAGITYAQDGMKKALTLQVWGEINIAWYCAQGWLWKWVQKELGGVEDLVGGMWDWK